MSKKLAEALALNADIIRQLRSSHGLNNEIANVMMNASTSLRLGLKAEEHLGNMLLMMQDLHPDDQCRAYEEALEFYNDRHPEGQVAPSDFGYRRYPVGQILMSYQDLAVEILETFQVGIVIDEPDIQGWPAWQVRAIEAALQTTPGDQDD